MSLLGTIFIILVVVAIVAAILYGIFSSLSGNDSENAPIHDHSQGDENCSACQQSSQPVSTTVPEKCLVLIRPKADWKGEFGMDWLRVGDTGMSGDTDYESIVGKYGDVYGSDPAAVFTPDAHRGAVLKGSNYNAFPVSWKKDAPDKTYLYPVPWLALFPQDQCSGNNKKCEATLVLNIEVLLKEPEQIRIDFNSEFFQLDKTEVTPKTVGKNSMQLNIKCIKEFDSDQEIKIIPFKTGGEDALAGKLKILKNNKENRYKANIVFVKVTTKINGVVKNGSTANEKGFLEKYLFQSLTTPNLTEESLNLADDANFNTNYTIQMNAVTKAVNVYLPDNTKVHTYLENKFNETKPGYGDWFKVFFFDENGGSLKTDASGTTSYSGLNGGAYDIPSKCVALFIGHNTSTTTHELLHAIGVYHTFDNDGLYTLKIGQTDDIMDYSHWNEFGNKDRISLWKWQWDKIHSGVSKE